MSAGQTSPFFSNIKSQEFLTFFIAQLMRPIINFLLVICFLSFKIFYQLHSRFFLLSFLLYDIDARLQMRAMHTNGRKRVVLSSPFINQPQQQQEHKHNKREPSLFTFNQELGANATLTLTLSIQQLITEKKINNQMTTIIIDFFYL